MAKEISREQIQKKLLNYGAHRKKYQKQIFDMIDEIRDLPSGKKADKINTYFVFKLYTLLQNFGLYQDYDILSTAEYFKNNDKVFYAKLEEYLNNLENKRKIYKALFVIKKSLLNIRDFSANGFDKDFLEDLKSETGLIVKNLYNNFIEPNIYQMDLGYKGYNEFLKDKNGYKDACKFDYYSETRKNKQANKKVQEALKEVLNGKN